MHQFAHFARRGVLVVSAATFVGAAAGAQSAVSVRPLPHTRLVLPNGLVALFNEDHASPIVGVGVWYHIGAKDEPKGQTGMAHLCEHMLFEGSPNVAPGEFMSIIKAAGGTSGRWGETSEDRTFYYETIPSNQLATTLWLEADRMSSPFTANDSTRLDPVRGSIKNERQANRENIPFGTADGATLDALYGKEHPYRDPLGPMDDVNRATFSEMKQFCTPYYVPNNAIVAISGDFETSKAKAMVTRYFGSIKRGAPVTHPTMRAASLAGDRRYVLEDSRSRVARLRVAWAGAGFASPDKLALVALASVLQGDRSSGLTKALVYDRQLATSVNVFHADVENGGVFQIEVIPRGTTALSAIEDVVDSLVAVVRQTAPSERELRRFKNANAIAAVASLQGRVFRADTLAQGEGWANDPVAYAKQVNVTSALTGADVQKAALRFLTPGRLVMSMIPSGKTELISKPDRPYDRLPSPTGGAVP
ncbi:MAG: pitrilysin family protein [bacterium]